MIACTSPGLIVRSTPLRICRCSPVATRAWRFLTSSSAISLALLSAVRFAFVVALQELSLDLFPRDRGLLSALFDHLPEARVGHVPDVFFVVMRCEQDI